MTDDFDIPHDSLEYFQPDSDPSYKKREFTVGNLRPLMRIDSYLSNRVPYSRHQIKKAIEEERVFLNGEPTRPATKVRKGDEIVFLFPPSSPKYYPRPLELDIFYEDDHILGINKPSGMAIHPGPGHKGDTLADGLVWRQLQKGIPPEEVRPGTVHRLDLPTSGVVLVGKHLEALHHLYRQFQRRTLTKEYLALVWGEAPEEGVIDTPMGKRPGDRFRSIVKGDGKGAKTSFERLETFPEFSLLKVWPKTGRTHQIRVHLESIGHPIFGDHLYGRQNYHHRQGNLPSDPFPEPRLCLHAHKLTFTHPHRKEPITFEAPLPSDFLEIMDQIRDFHFPR